MYILEYICIYPSSFHASYLRFTAYAFVKLILIIYEFSATNLCCHIYAAVSPCHCVEPKNVAAFNANSVCWRNIFLLLFLKFRFNYMHIYVCVCMCVIVRACVCVSVCMRLAPLIISFCLPLLFTIIHRVFFDFTSNLR